MLLGSRLRNHASFWLLGAGALLLSSACGGADPSGADPSCESFACQGCEGGTCGTVSGCERDGECAAGQYCATDGECRSDCVMGGNACGQGEACDDRGRCAPVLIDIGAGVGSGGGQGSGHSGDACVELEVKFEPAIPNVVLLVDQSGSMDANLGGDGPRWNVLRNALLSSTDGIVTTLEDKVRFGLALYTGPEGVGPMRRGPSSQACPILTEVDVALNNRLAIADKYEFNDWKWETPTGESLDLVAAKLSEMDDDGPKVIVLATDGEPDTCLEPNPQNGQQASIEAVQRAHADGITTFVISVGSDVGEEHLRHVANAGQGLEIDVDQEARYHLANNAAELEDAFDEIINGVRSCQLSLNGTVDANNAASGQVALDGAPLSYEDANGWRLNSPTEIELLGDACEAIKHGDHELDISFPCGVIVPRVE